MINKMSFNLSLALQQLIVGQKRTGKHKQFVFFYGDYVIKGPFSSTGRIENIKTRSTIFTAWKTPCVVKYINEFKSDDPEPNIYVMYDNIMKQYKLESEPYHESFSGLNYNILKNPPIVSVNTLIDKKGYEWITNNAEDLLLAVVHCNILGVGDMNLRNVLVDPNTKEFYVIDFDDNLTSDRDDEVFYFNKHPSKKSNWYQRVNMHYNNVADRLEPLLTDEIVLKNNLLSRVQRAINLLRQYATTNLFTVPVKTPELSKTSNNTRVVCVKVTDIRKEGVDNLGEWMKNPNNIYIGRKGVVLINKRRFPEIDSIWANPFKIKNESGETRENVIAKYREYIIDKLQKGEITVEQLESLRGKTLGCWCKEGGQNIPCHGDVLIELLDLNEQGKLFFNQTNSLPNIQSINLNGNIGSMIWKGLRGGASKTYSGHDFDVVKSALQKYIRRGMVEKALLSAIELYRFGELGAKEAVSNLFNRLAIIANEDIGPANLPLVLAVTEYVESGNKDVNYMAAIVHLMAESKKTRLMSQAWRAYANPEGRLVAKQMGLSLDEGFTQDDIDFYTQYVNSELFLPSDPQNIRPYLLIFYKRLLEGNFNAYSWAYFFLESIKDIKSIEKRNKYINNNKSKTGKPDILLWKVLGKFLPPKTHDILVEAYYNHTESRPFLQNAILITLYKLPYEFYDLKPIADLWSQQPSLNEMLEGKYKLEIDDFAIDKHTRLGKQKGKTIKDFVNEGAYVANQDPKYENELLAKIYLVR